MSRRLLACGIQDVHTRDNACLYDRKSIMVNSSNDAYNCGILQRSFFELPGSSRRSLTSNKMMVDVET